jgi:hypothetical protein
MTAGDYFDNPPHPQPQKATAESLMDHVTRLRADRDRAVGAVFVLVYDAVISEGRARELLGMTVHQVRDEVRRLLDQGATP